MATAVTVAMAAGTISRCLPTAQAKITRCQSICSHKSARLQWDRQQRRGRQVVRRCSAGLEPMDLTERNVELALLEARAELLQLFDSSVGITGVAELADLDGPFVTLRLQGRFWHQRSMVLARLSSFLRKRIPEILEVHIEDPSQLDDSSTNF